MPGYRRSATGQISGLSVPRSAGFSDGSENLTTRGVKAMGARVLRTPVRAPKANAECERLGGSLRRECLDFLIPVNEGHLKMTVEE